VGRPSITIGAQYTSFSADDRTVPIDAQRLVIAMGLPLFSRLTALGDYSATRQDSVVYNATGGLRVYLGNPRSDRPVNPDGPTGLPVLTFRFGARFGSRDGIKTRTTGSFDLVWPVSSRLSLGSGYSYMQERVRLDLEEWRCSATYYSASYRPDSAYTNPDAPVGSIAITLSGGGSGNGLFGQAGLLVALNRGSSVFFTTRVDSYDTGRLKGYSLGAAISLYPGAP